MTCLGCTQLRTSKSSRGTSSHRPPYNLLTSTQQIISHLSDHRDAELAGFLLAIVAVALLFWFLGYLRDVLDRAEGDRSALANVTLVSWVALLVIAVAGAVPLVAVAWRGAGKIDPGIVRLAFDASNLSLYSLSATAALLSVLAPIILIWRTKVLPRWLVGLGAIGSWSISSRSRASSFAPGTMLPDIPSALGRSFGWCGLGP